MQVDEIYRKYKVHENETNENNIRKSNERTKLEGKLKGMQRNFENKPKIIKRRLHEYWEFKEH